MQQFCQQLINGLSWGAIYALIAVGYTMVYGVLRLINFAHGDVYMVGAMSGWYVALKLQGATVNHPWLRHIFDPNQPTWHGFAFIFVVCVAICALLGYIIELVAYRPLRNQPKINALITAIGVSMFLEYGGQKFFSADPQAFPMLIPHMERHAELFTFHGVVLDKIDALIMTLTFALMIALHFIVMKTRAGLALRAVSARFDTASLMGVNVNRIISFTFVLGSALAGVAGVLVAIRAPKVDPLMGLVPGLKAFIAAVLGGIGNIPGAVAGGLLLGLTETFVDGYLPHGSQYRDGVAFVILIAVLLIKPSGIFGSNAIEKV